MLPGFWARARLANRLRHHLYVPKTQQQDVVWGYTLFVRLFAHAYNSHIAAGFRLNVSGMHFRYIA